MAPDDLKFRARRMVEEVLNQGDLAVANELISPGCVHHLAAGLAVPGLAALRDWLALTLRARLKTVRGGGPGDFWIFRGGVRRVAEVTQEAPGNRMGVESSAIPGASRAVVPCPRQ